VVHAQLINELLTSEEFFILALDGLGLGLEAVLVLLALVLEV
jgi:hypothetical protein